MMPDWKKARTLQGSAIDAPKLIAALSKRSWATAYEELRAALVSEGQWSEAAVAAVPLLTKAAASGKAGSHRALWLLSDVVTGDALAHIFKASSESALGQEATAAVVASFEQLEPLCEHKSEATRAAMAMLLGCLPASPTTCEMLNARLTSELHPEVLATLWLSAARLAASHDSYQLPSPSAVIADEEAAAIVRAAAALGDLIVNSSLAASVIGEGLAVKLSRDTFPWGLGLFEEVLTRAAEQRSECEAGVVRGAAKAVHHIAGYSRAMSCLAAISGLARFDRYATVRVEELSAKELEVAAVIVAEGARLPESWGLPPHARHQARWLGSAPAGLLEREVTLADGSQGPLWVRLREIGDVGEHPDKWVAPEIAEQLTDAERYLLTVELALGAYRIPAPSAVGRLNSDMVELASAAPAAATEGLAALADELVAAPSSGPDSVISILVMWPLHRAGIPLAERHDSLISIRPESIGRELLEALPEARREPVVWAQCQINPFSSSTNPMGLEIFVGLLDLAPSARVAAVVAAKLTNPQSLAKLKRQGIDVAPLLRRYQQIAEQHPDLKLVLQQARKRA